MKKKPQCPTHLRRESYTITAVNPLTHNREPVTLPCSKSKAEKMLVKEKKRPPRKRAWKYPKVEILPSQQLTFNFKD